MLWSVFLHIYQPPDQRPEILEKIVNESYRPLLKGFLSNPRARLTLNINACLTELLVENGFSDVIEGLGKLAENGQLEFTGSAKYHPFLPLLPKEEIIRQIKLNDETNAKFFAKAWQPQGFFPPEMGYDKKVGEVVAELGFDWVILDEIAYSGKIDIVDFSKIYKLSFSRAGGHEFFHPTLALPVSKSSRSTQSFLSRGAAVSVGMSKIVARRPLRLVFRERRTSNLIMGAVSRTTDSITKSLASEIPKKRYLVTAMDGETFGHHRPGLENLLFDLFALAQFKFVTVSEMIKMFPGGEEISPVSSCWASSEEEIEKGEPFYLYFRQKNKLHGLLKNLLDLAIKVAGEASGEERVLLDKAESCNAFWWANPDAWWSLEEIELGAFNLKNVVVQAKAANDQEKEQARLLYQEILSQAFSWQREGLIHRLHAKKQAWIKIPFKKRAKPGEYEAIIEILKKELKRAVDRQEFEQAIRWRDSIYKLEHGLDIYNLVHIVDQLRAEGRLGEYAKLTEKYKKRYKRIVPGQPE